MRAEQRSDKGQLFLDSSESKPLPPEGRAWFGVMGIGRLPATMTVYYRMSGQVYRCHLPLAAGREYWIDLQHLRIRFDGNEVPLEPTQA